jgi:microcystin-dependent protein
MADPFIAEIKMFAGNFPPKGWAFCNGQLMPIAQNTALFALLGTHYGGDGKSTFALPDLQARTPMHPGQGLGLTNRVLGETGGEAAVTFLPQELPVHGHAFALPAVNAAATTANPEGALPAITGENLYATQGSPVNLSPDALAPAGASQPHNNRQLYLAMNFIIALQGIFPARW